MIIFMSWHTWCDMVVAAFAVHVQVEPLALLVSDVRRPQTALMSSR